MDGQREMAHDALSALLDFARIRDTPHVTGYRSGERLLVTDGCLVLRLEPDDPAELDAFEEFAGHAEISKWKFPIKLFRCDVKTLSDWARNDRSLISECTVCKQGIAEVTEDIDGNEISPAQGPCMQCGGAMVTTGEPSHGWLTCKRLVDRRYVELVAALARDTDTIDVRAREHSAISGLHFRGKAWDAFLMPFKDLPAGTTAAPALWTPQPVLEGENA